MYWVSTLFYSKLVHCLEWHPHQVSESTEESPNKNLIATCALEKNGQIVILELCENEGKRWIPSFFLHLTVVSRVTQLHRVTGGLPISK